MQIGFWEPLFNVYNLCDHWSWLWEIEKYKYVLINIMYSDKDSSPILHQYAIWYW